MGSFAHEAFWGVSREREKCDKMPDGIKPNRANVARNGETSYRDAKTALFGAACRVDHAYIKEWGPVVTPGLFCLSWLLLEFERFG